MFVCRNHFTLLELRSQVSQIKIVFWSTIEISAHRSLDNFYVAVAINLGKSLMFFVFVNVQFWFFVWINCFCLFNVFS